jgi:hypothetical protein
MNVVAERKGKQKRTEEEGKRPITHYKFFMFNKRFSDKQTN